MVAQRGDVLNWGYPTVRWFSQYLNPLMFMLLFVAIVQSCLSARPELSSGFKTRQEWYLGSALVTWASPASLVCFWATQEYRGLCITTMRVSRQAPKLPAPRPAVISALSEWARLHGLGGLYTWGCPPPVKQVLCSWASKRRQIVFLPQKGSRARAEFALLSHHKLLILPYFLITQFTQHWFQSVTL